MSDALDDGPAQEDGAHGAVKQSRTGCTTEPGGRRPRGRSGKARQEDLEKRKKETGSRRGDAKAGHGKDPPPNGGRNRRGRGG